MDNILRTVSSLSILVFAVSSMLSAGASFTVRQVVAPMREPDRVLRALLGNFVLVPILAVVIGRALALDSPLALGLILLGTAAGAPFLIKLVAAAEGDVALGTSLLVLLVPMTVVFMPIIVPLLAPDTSVNATAIAISLALTMLIPLAIGLVVNEVAGRAAKRLRHATRNLSTVSLVFLLVTTLLVNRYDLQVIIGSRAIIAVVLFVIGCFCIGFLIASPHPARRVVLGLGTAQRNIAAATIVAAEDIGHSDTLTLVVVASIIDLLILFPIARWLSRRLAREEEEASLERRLHPRPVEAT